MAEHEVRESSGCTVIEVDAEYTREVFLQLLDVVREVVDRGRPRLILNMDSLPHITSEGIGLLVLVHDECTQADGRMVLANVPHRVERVLKLAGVVNFFSIHPDERAAIRALKTAVPDVEEKPEAEEHVDPALSRPPVIRNGAEPDASCQETALREIVSEVIKSRRHQQVIDFLTKQNVKSASLDQIAGMTSMPRPTAEHVMRDLAAGGLVKREGEVFVWQPSPGAERKLDLFKKALSDPNLRSRVLAWIYAEEKKA